jgi:hypothetical protein
MLVIPALALLALGAFVTFATTATTSSSLRYTASSTEREVNSSSTQAAEVIPEEPVFVVTHQDTPVPMRGLYMTSCVAATPSWRAKLVKMIEETELNAVVIDIKDYTGTLSFPLESQEFVQNTNGCFVKDMKEFIGTLHEKHIYVIGRVQVFQDKTYTKSHPEYAVKKKDGTVWKDYKGISFIDVGARPYWEHIARLAISSYEIGFDEINFDYIRYPSDGDMKNIWFSQTGSSTKPVMLETFFKDLRERIPAGQPVISADLFGMTTTNTDDLNIGQVLERALPHFDYVAPMVYPSHFPPQFNGWKNPNLVPGEVISYSMGKAVLRARALEEKESGFVASTSTPKFIPTDKYTKKLRPWIEDFDCCAPTTHHYTEADVRAQIEATYKVGLTDWVLWDPANHYTPSALKSTE